MATVVKQEWFDVKRSDTFKIKPLGDIHLGAAACDEKSFQREVDDIKEDENAYWVGLGDFCDFINMKDPRFNVSSLADWVITKRGLSDVAKTQKERFIGIIAPIASKCLGVVMGNHEKSIAKHYERDIYSEIVTEIKQLGGFEPDKKLGIGYYGWLKLLFYMKKDKQAVSTITINLHHGFVGGKLAGAKALNMQRWLWSHDADIVIFGHSHNEGSQTEAVEYLDRGDNIRIKVKKGMYAGTFLKSTHQDGEGSSTYSEEKGYFPLAHSVIPHIILTPHAAQDQDRIKILT